MPACRVQPRCRRLQRPMGPVAGSTITSLMAAVAAGVMSHLTYEVGGGFNAPTSDSSPYITWGWNFTVGGGYRFDKHLALNLEYQFIDSKLPGAIIAQAGATGGYAHIWSFTLDPAYDFNPKSAIEFYATGG